MKVNLEARQLQSLGLNLEAKTPTEPTIFSYNVQVHTGKGFTGKQVIDLTKPDQVGRTLNKLSAAQNNPYGSQLDELFIQGRSK